MVRVYVHMHVCVCVKKASFEMQKVLAAHQHSSCHSASGLLLPADLGTACLQPTAMKTLGVSK